MEKEEYHKLIAEGKCPLCKKEKNNITDQNNAYCSECRKIRAKYRDKTRYRKLIANGICPLCNKKKSIADPKYAYCSKCRDSKKKVQNKQYHQFIADEKCPLCKEVIPDQERDEKHTLCLKCRVSRKNNRESALWSGICPRCLKKPLFPGYNQCKDCLNKRKKYYKYQPIRDEDKRQAYIENQKNRYYRLKKEGKCPSCLVELKEVQLKGENFVYCPQCRSFHTKKKIAKSEEPKQKKSKKGGSKLRLKTKGKKILIRNERLQDAFQRIFEEHGLVFLGVRPVKKKAKIERRTK
jgi:hypothetical protein